MKIQFLLVVCVVFLFSSVDAGRCHRRNVCELITTNPDGTKSVRGCPMYKLMAGCHMEPANLKLPYPNCCPKAVCPKKGCSKWTVSKNGNRTGVTCATFALRPGSNCRRVPGDPNAPYPGCCEKPVCPPKIKK